MLGAAETEPSAVQLLACYQPLFDPAPAWRYAFLTGGRGGGKSFHAAVFLLNLTYEPEHVILFTRWTMVAASISIIPEFVEKLSLLGLEDDFEVRRDAIVNRRTGSRILFRGIKTSSGNQSARLKSIQGVTTWVLDEAEELVDEKTFDTIDYSVRQLAQHNRVILVLNPSVRTHFLYARFVESRRTDTLYIHTTYQQNAHNLSRSFIEQAERLEATNPARYRHIFLGEWMQATEGLLWTEADLVRSRVDVAPDAFARVLVGIDPAVTVNASSNETGIVVVGLGKDGRGYVLEDLSGRYSPAQWGAVAIDAARRWNGSIVAEVNQGGDMVRSVLFAQGTKAQGIRVVDVRATRGKLARAEPVYALYQEGRVSHVGHLPILEQQMKAFGPEQVDGSPDRVDALVWALSSLLLKKLPPFVI